MSSPLIAAKFDPTHTHFASAVQALDTHQVKVQALVVAQDSLNTSFSLSKGQKIAVVEWISYSELAVGLTNGTVLVYTPASNSISAEFQTPSTSAITDIHYSTITQTVWSSDVDGNFFELDTSSFRLLQSFSLSDMIDSVESVSRLASIMYQNEPHLLVGTHNVYLVDVLAKTVVRTFPAHVQPIVSLTPVSSDADLFLTAAEGDRFINLYSIARNSTKAVLVAKSTVSSITLGISGDLSIVSAITENGTLEIFKNPLSSEAPAQESSKKRRKQLANSVQSKHSDATVKYSRPEDEIRNPDDELLPVTAVSLTDSILNTTWVDSGAISRFDAVPWHTNNEFAFSGAVNFKKSKQEIKPTSHATSGHDVAAPKHYSEGNVVVTEGGAFQNDLVNSEDEDDDETLAERMEKLTGGSQRRSALGKKKLKKHNAGTLTIVLSQALRNNDHSLLETVLANRDPSVVKNTIQRLEASLAIVLLDRLAERITRQQQRFDQMNFWLKWIIIIHGGVLSSMPNLSNKLASLHAVLTKKASTLPRLLELQGRLSMIEEQASLRKDILNGTAQNDYDDADTDVEYVEEIDDAVEAGILGSEDEDDEIDMDAADDYEDDEDEDDEILDANLHSDDGLSDVETAVVNNDVYDDDE